MATNQGTKKIECKNCKRLKTELTLERAVIKSLKEQKKDLLKKIEQFN